MQEHQYPEMSDAEIQEMINGPFAQEIMKKTEIVMRYIHEHFLREFYKEFPEFYNYVVKSEDNAYLMEDLGDGELRAIPSPIMGALLHYIEILMKNGKIDEVKNILRYLEKGFQSKDPEIKNLITGFLYDFHIIPNILHNLVRLLPPGMHGHFMEYNSDLLEI